MRNIHLYRLCWCETPGLRCCGSFPRCWWFNMIWDLQQTKLCCWFLGPAAFAPRYHVRVTATWDYPCRRRPIPHRPLQTGDFTKRCWWWLSDSWQSCVSCLFFREGQPNMANILHVHTPFKAKAAGLVDLQHTQGCLGGIVGMLSLLKNNK